MRSYSWPMRSASAFLCLLALAPGAHADQKADDLLKEVERATKSVSSLGAKLQVTLTTQNLAARPTDPRQPRQSDSGFTQGNEPLSFTYTGTVKLQRPNLERIQLGSPVNQTVACDGTAFWTLLSSNEYIKNPADPLGKTPGAYAPILMFFAPETARTAGTIPAPDLKISDNFSTRYLGKERVSSTARAAGQGAGGDRNAEECDVVEVRQVFLTPQSVKLYINSDKMVIRVVSETRRGNISTIQDVSLVDIRPGQRFDAAEFAFTLPENARPYVFKPAPVNR